MTRDDVVDLDAIYPYAGGYLPHRQPGEAFTYRTEYHARAYPSGMLHRYIGTNASGSLDVAACGVRSRRISFDYPPGVRRCPVCYPVDDVAADVRILR